MVHHSIVSTYKSNIYWVATKLCTLRFFFCLPEQAHCSYYIPVPHWQEMCLHLHIKYLLTSRQHNFLGKIAQELCAIWPLVNDVNVFMGFTTCTAIWRIQLYIHVSVIFICQVTSKHQFTHVLLCIMWRAGTLKMCKIIAVYNSRSTVAVYSITHIISNNWHEVKMLPLWPAKGWRKCASTW